MAVVQKPLIIVPGIAGNELTWLPPFFSARRAVWASVTKLAVGGIQWLALNPAGTGPLSSWYPSLEAGGGVSGYYDDLRYWLEKTGHTVEYAYIDWRKPIAENADVLLTDIRRLAEVAPVRIVSHSRGGLVAAAAMQQLAASGELALVRQGVSLGPPWRGSYAPIGYFGGWDSFVLTLSILSTYALAATGGVSGFQPIRLVVQTWPSMYELLPDPVAAAAQGETDIDSVYDWRAWSRAKVPVTDAHLQAAKARWAAHPTLPPGIRWTTIAGNGYPTRGPTNATVGWDDPRSVQKKFDGDGIVPYWSASATPGEVIPWYVSHSDMVRDGGVIERVQEILAS